VTFRDFTKQVGSALRAQKALSKVSVKTLAANAGVSRYTVQRVFDGHPASLHTIWKLCQAMDSQPAICIAGWCTEGVEQSNEK
jgi:predicted transcriptional regulator